MALGSSAALPLTAFAAPANAISDGQPDTDDKYPYVGVVLVPAAGGGLWMCSGAAISSTKVVTAAHCIDDWADPGPEKARVSFAFDPPQDPALFVDTGTIYPHPAWCIGCGPGLKGFDTHDVAVIVLDIALDLKDDADPCLTWSSWTLWRTRRRSMSRATASSA